MFIIKCNKKNLAFECKYKNLWISYIMELSDDFNLSKICRLCMGKDLNVMPLFVDSSLSDKIITIIPLLKVSILCFLIWKVSNYKLYNSQVSVILLKLVGTRLQVIHVNMTAIERAVHIFIHSFFFPSVLDRSPSFIQSLKLCGSGAGILTNITNSMAYGTRRFNVAFRRALQYSLSCAESTQSSNW